VSIPGAPSIADAALARKDRAAAIVRPESSRDDRLMRLFIGVIGLYLIVALALPLGLMLAKSLEGPREEFVGLANYVRYFSTPALFQSIGNSLWVSILSTAITVPLAFVYAYALTRSLMPFRGFFKTVALVPILVPSLLPGLALVYLFGNQGLLKAAMLGRSIYGPIGIVMAEVFTTFPHALLIILAALALADLRLYEAAVALRASRPKIFWTVTLPGARYGLISATFVVFTTVITDFGAPKVIGGQYNVLATDVYKQVIGQQNFQMGAVVSVILLVPAIFAFVVDRIVRRRQVALLSARAVPYEPKPQRLFDLSMLAYCVVTGLAILSIVAISQFAAVVKFFPYNLTVTWAHYDFDTKGGGGWASYYNSIRLALLTGIVGTVVVFVGAYLVEKTRGFALGRGLFHFLAMLPMAVPGLVLGLAYIFFFNAPSNPLNVLYRTMTILVVNTIVHFYTVGHLTALTALRQMDPEFETVSASLKQPFYRTFWRVTVPVCLPSTLDIAIYMFVNAMTTVSGVVFIYGPMTELASISVLNMDDTGEIASAAAMAMMIFYTNVAARVLHLLLGRWLERRTQAWRRR
jgi:iron(III) transport system permease protein